MWGGIPTATILSLAASERCAALTDPESRMGSTRSRIAPFLLLALLAACGPDLAPKEEFPCSSRGTLTAGSTSAGHLGEASCASVSDAVPGLATNRDRWTLQVHPDTVYVVSATYLVRPGESSWAGRLLGYTAEGGDTLLRTGYWGTAGIASGGLLQEMLIAGTTDGRIIIHLERATITDSGTYRLEVRRCAMIHLTPGVTSPPIGLDNGCPLWSAGLPGHARFFVYPSDSGVVRDVRVTQTGAEVPIYYAWAARPPLNFACWYAGGSCDLGNGGSSEFTIRPYPVDGITAGVLFTTGPTATVTVRVDAVP